MPRPLLLATVWSCLSLSLASPALSAEKTLKFTLSVSEPNRVETPVRVLLSLEQPFAKAPSVSVQFGDRKLTGQLTTPSLATVLPSPAQGSATDCELVFILPKCPAGEHAVSAKISTDAATAGPVFAWKETPNEAIDLTFDGKPVLQYYCKPLDDSDKGKRELTYKPFHHVYDFDGKSVITKGPGGGFTHHRGLFFGFNKVAYGENGEKKADVWHCTGDAFQSHDGVVSAEAGPVLARHVLRIGWHGPKKETFADELREVTVYNTAGGRLIEFASTVTTKVGNISLDGDPQHAGFHFRASNEVHDATKGQTYYLRPDGKDSPGKTRNWPGQKEHVNLAWDAMSFVVGGQRYTAVYLDRPENPKEARFSERDYGRFGSYFEYTITEKAPLQVDYRVWLQKGELSVEEAAVHSANFVAPPKASDVSVE